MYFENTLVVRNYTTREELRRMVVLQFLEEEPGNGSGDAVSRYRYNVEILNDGKMIYLIRPAYLKKGFDFRINVEGIIFKTKHEYPKHSDIFNDLKLKRQEYPAICDRLHQAIERV